VTEGITPALTAKQWANGGDVDLCVGLVWASLSSDPTDRNGELEAIDAQPPYLRIDWGITSDAVSVVNRHPLAALALHDQPFGFTRADVIALTDAIRDAKVATLGYGDHGDVKIAMMTYGDEGKQIPALRSLRDRIAALLPPEGA